jgi:Ni,Fe-hydrogenase I cytochrome b subunit
MASGAQTGPQEKPQEPPIRLVTAAYEHPWAVRFTHWLNAVVVLVLVTSGLRIFIAFPSFGPKIPEHDIVNIPGALTLGGWLGGALQWHFTFMWLFAGGGLLYLAYQFCSGHYKTVLFMPRDVNGVWPMVRHYFLFGAKRNRLAVDGTGALQAGAVFLAGVADGRLSPGAGMALCGHVRVCGVHSWTHGHGGTAWLV